MVKNENEQFETGVVVEALPNTLFRVELDTPKFEGSGEKKEKELVLVYLSGKMRIYRIKVLVGDKVKIQMDPYGGRGRVVQRVK